MSLKKKSKKLYYQQRIDDINFLTSLNIELIDSNIDSITGFRLFLPHTRADNGKIEIITTNLLRELGFFAPRTKKILTKNSLLILSANHNHEIPSPFQLNDLDFQ